MTIQALIRAQGLPERDLEDIFRLLGDGAQYHAGRKTWLDLETACGMNTVFFVARPDEGPAHDIVGLAVFHIIHLGSHKEGLVTRVEVPPNRRWQGIGISLVKAIVGHVFKERIPRVRLLHPLGDHAADRVFREHGFVPDADNTLYIRRDSESHVRRSCVPAWRGPY